MVLGPASVVSLVTSVSSGASFDPVSTSSEAVEAIEEILIPNSDAGSLSPSRLSEAVEAIEEILIPNPESGSLSPVSSSFWFSEAVEAIEEILIPNSAVGSLSSTRLSEVVEAIEEILIPNPASGSLSALISSSSFVPVSSSWFSEAVEAIEEILIPNPPAGSDVLSSLAALSASSGELISSIASSPRTGYTFLGVLTRKPLKDRQFQVVYLCSLFRHTLFIRTQDYSKLP